MQPPSGLLFTDLDGTLLDDRGAVAEASSDGVALARAAGVAVIAATARSLRSTRALREAAGLDAFVVAVNGAVGYDAEGDQVVWARTLPRGLVADLGDLLARIDPGFYLAAGSLAGFAAEPGFFPDQPEGVPRGQLEGEDGVVNLIVRHRDLDAQELIEVLGPRIVGLSLVPGSHDWVDVLAHGVTKGLGVGLASEYLGVPLERCGAVGDHRNDLPMFDVVGHRFAVANALACVQAAADEVVPSNVEGGVGEAARRMAARSSPCDPKRS
jgi:hydroxymethylpyrimidine pyrophosphatase-like HAD family hydrolase